VRNYWSELLTVTKGRVVLVVEKGVVMRYEIYERPVGYVLGLKKVKWWFEGYPSRYFLFPF